MAETLRSHTATRFAPLPSPALVPSFDLAKAPWIRPGAVVHEPTALVDDLLAAFAREIRERGFSVAESDGSECPQTAAQTCLRHAMRDDADLVVIGQFPAFESASQRLMAAIGKGGLHGMPVLTSVAGSHVHKYQEFTGLGGAMIPPDAQALWQWWGAEKLYHDLILGVPHDEVRRISCGPRWIMVEGPHGTGLAFLPQNPKELIGRLPRYRRASLRQLADLAQSWDPLEMAVGLAAINAHYNRADLEGPMGGGAHLYHREAGRREAGRVVAVGVFPGMAEALPDALVVKHEPGAGEYPLEALDSLLPGSAAAVITSSNIANRKLPRLLRLAQGARCALLGPGTPLTPRLFSYGVDLLGGLVITDPEGLALAVRAGVQPREFEHFGHYLHLRREQVSPRSPTPSAKPD